MTDSEKAEIVEGVLAGKQVERCSICGRQLLVDRMRCLTATNTEWACVNGDSCWAHLFAAAKCR